MARDFIIQTQFSPAYPGGPFDNCSQCGITDPKAEYVVRTNAEGEDVNPRTGHPQKRYVQFCAGCVTKMFKQVGGLPADEAGALRAQVIQAEAARARAEKRADVAETALASVLKYAQVVEEMDAPEWVK